MPAPLVPLAPPVGATIHAPVDPPTAPVERAVHGLTTSIEPAVDTVATILESGGGDLPAVSCRAIRGSVVPTLGAIAAPIEVVLDTIAALVEPALDPVTATIGAFTRALGVYLRGARHQTQTEPYCTEFHCVAS